MEPRDFERWVDRMVEERELTRYEVAELLGTTPSQLVRWSNYPPPPYIDWAVAAIMADLKPWPNVTRRKRLNRHGV